MKQHIFVQGREVSPIYICPEWPPRKRSKENVEEVIRSDYNPEKGRKFEVTRIGEGVKEYIEAEGEKWKRMNEE